MADKNLNPSRTTVYGQPTNSPDFVNDPTGQNNQTNKYSIGNAQYPNDLYGNQQVYGGNYVVFYINVADDSKLVTEDKATTITGDLQTGSRQRGGLIGQDLGGIQQTAAVGTLAVGTAVGANVLTGKGANVVGSAKAAALPVAGAAAVAILGNSRQQKRLTQAIALHVPNQLNIRYSTEWQSEDTFAYQAAAVANADVARAINPANILSLFKNIGGAIGDAGAAGANVALSKTPGVSGAMSAASGLAANPKKEQVFKNVNFREFSFDYTFSPRNAAEAENVKNIIQLFKYHMHPEYKDKNNFLFIYPSEFDIFYYQNGKENLNLHRHTSCVLKDMNINYTPNGAFNTFDNGMPTQINITLSFIELAILTKELIKDRF